LLTLTNSGPITFNDPSLVGGYNLSGATTASDPGNYLLTAEFTSKGAYIANTGTLRITGDLVTSSGYTVSGNLLTATLVNFAFDQNVLGFSTDLLSGYGTLFSQGEHELQYFYASNLATELGFTSGSLIATTSPIMVSVITQVPLPGALSVFVLGLGVLFRSNRKTA
jgi:hypothetical protein